MDPTEDQIPLVQRVASKITCPVCGRTGTYKVTKVVVDDEHLMQVECTGEDCPVREHVAMGQLGPPEGA